MKGCQGCTILRRVHRTPVRMRRTARRERASSEATGASSGRARRSARRSGRLRSCRRDVGRRRWLRAPGRSAAGAHGHDRHDGEAPDARPPMRDQRAHVQPADDRFVAPGRRDKRPGRTPTRRAPTNRIRPSRARNAPSAGRRARPTRMQDRRQRLVGLRWLGRQGRRQRAPRSRAQEGGRPGRRARVALAGSAQDHRELADTQHEQHGQDGQVSPATDRGTEQGRDVATPVSSPPTTPSASSIAPSPGRGSRPGWPGSTSRCSRTYPIRAADDRAGHRPDRDEQEVVRGGGRRAAR